MVYSITDRNSFNHIKLMKQHILDTRYFKLHISGMPSDTLNNKNVKMKEYDKTTHNVTNNLNLNSRYQQQQLQLQQNAINGGNGPNNNNNNNNNSSDSNSGSNGFNGIYQNSSSISAPLVLLGNKGDMVHLRQVATEEGNEIC